MTSITQLTTENDRILSIDFFRGVTMFLLIGEFAQLFGSLKNSFFDGTIIWSIGNQLHHHPWNGLHFWDLVQPFFMFIVGVAMPFSFSKRWARGETWKATRIILYGGLSGCFFSVGPFIASVRVKFSTVSQMCWSSSQLPT